MLINFNTLLQVGIIVTMASSAVALPGGGLGTFMRWPKGTKRPLDDDCDYGGSSFGTGRSSGGSGGSGGGGGDGGDLSGLLPDVNCQDIIDQYNAAVKTRGEKKFTQYDKHGNPDKIPQLKHKFSRLPTNRRNRAAAEAEVERLEYDYKRCMNAKNGGGKKKQKF